MSLWLIGAGPHAREYAKVLMDLQHPFEVIGRGAASAQDFQSSMGKSVRTGGLVAELALHGAPEQAIVATSFDQLSAVASTLIRAGTRSILLEKPAALSLSDVRALNQLADEKGAQVGVAYNRRFYTSTTKARELILEDGGATSCVFEFTEWSHTIDPMPLPEVTKAAWMIANSSHVADLAFHLCGAPADWQAWQSGAMNWHPAAARFSGAGVTERGILFSYHADWDAPGRWGVEVLTRKRRFIFRPMESLQVTHLASTKVEPVVLNDKLDVNFKPGLYRQTQAFLDGKPEMFCTLAEQERMIAVYAKMAGYTKSA
jgi:predicted dehydrogenase